MQSDVFCGTLHTAGMREVHERLRGQYAVRLDALHRLLETTGYSASGLSKMADLTPSTLLRHINGETESMFEALTVALVAEAIRRNVPEKLSKEDRERLAADLSMWETGGEDGPGASDPTLVPVDPDAFAILSEYTGRLVARHGMNDLTSKDKLLLSLKVYRLLTRKYPKLTKAREEKEFKKHEDAIEMLVLADA